MANPLAPSRAAINASLPAGRPASGIWSLAGTRLVALDYAGEAALDRPLVLVPSEQVLLLAAVLPPLASTLRRRAALPFAIEDHIAQPLDQVHIALGVETAPGVWLAAVAGHAQMALWLALVADAGLERAVLVPDALTVPVPDAGWAIDLAGERALVRVDDGSGFAVPLALLDAAWRAAGEPTGIAYGDPLPASFTKAFFASPLAPLADRLRAPAIDLRQGMYAAPRRAFNPLWRQVALVAGLGALAHGAIAIADTIALAHLADQRAAQVRLAGASLQPAVVIGPDLGDAIVAMTADAGVTRSSRFMGLLSRSAAALAGGTPAGPGAPAGTAVNPTVWRSLSFDDAAGTLTIELETADIADLQRMAQALTRAGLSVQPGSAASQGGKAVGSFVVRAP